MVVSYLSAKSNGKPNGAAIVRSATLLERLRPSQRKLPLVTSIVSGFSLMSSLISVSAVLAVGVVSTACAHRAPGVLDALGVHSITRTVRFFRATHYPHRPSRRSPMIYTLFLTGEPDFGTIFVSQPKGPLLRSSWSIISTNKGWAADATSLSSSYTRAWNACETQAAIVCTRRVRTHDVEIEHHRGSRYLHLRSELVADIEAE
ncbi:hypothetical protein BDK51DRAFT_28987 [Blyttiomyces helicus]|uniref:Uncharacterized protein n=1 Tax=Blyttiomyces helicus TaxID=388810 RepID=A0A4P9WMB9_9FUNG|nr:hypothetical protein BDK51DRAFT_28987 [Blyttiomyces helicus]|eukprot:RKO93355.1 hypothetical protein BDK51DRAFT_28987 [Blyttiomyces helicus]